MEPPALGELHPGSLTITCRSSLCQECQAGSAAPALMASLPTEELGWSYGRSPRVVEFSLPTAERWDELIFRVPPNPNHSALLGFCEVVLSQQDGGESLGCVRSLNWVLFPSIYYQPGNEKSACDWQQSQWGRKTSPIPHSVFVPHS